MIAEAPSGGSGESQRVLGAHHPVGRQQGQRSAAGALAEQQADRRRVEQHQVLQRPGDLAGQPALLGLARQRRARRCRSP